MTFILTTLQSKLCHDCYQWMTLSNICIWFLIYYIAEEIRTSIWYLSKHTGSFSHWIYNTHPSEAGNIKLSRIFCNRLNICRKWKLQNPSDGCQNQIPTLLATGPFSPVHCYHFINTLNYLWKMMYNPLARNGIVRELVKCQYISTIWLYYIIKICDLLCLEWILLWNFSCVLTIQEFSRFVLTLTYIS